MNSAAVDDFSVRLSRELEALSWQDRNSLLRRIDRQEQQMRTAGQERPVWRGPAPVDELLGAEVVIPTDHGERRGRVICYGVVSVGGEFERSVVVHVPASGTQHEAPGSSARLASPEDLERMRAESAMAVRLAEAAYAAHRGPKHPEQALRRQRQRGMRDPLLVERMLAAARAHPKVTAVDESQANFKISGSVALGPQGESRRLYLFKAQLRVDISGYAVDHPAVRHISDEEARDMHLGRVRGQITFDDREAAFEAFERALDGLR